MEEIVGNKIKELEKQLAAEREAWAKERDLYDSRINDFGKQLAAERSQTELWKTENESRAILIRKIADLVGYNNDDGFHSSPDLLEMVEQLAAERENVKKITEYAAKLDDWNDDLQQQLTAAVEALELAEQGRISKNGIAAALAKIQKP